jgi:hypothetical protein
MDDLHKSSTGFHLAQLNIARALAPMDDLLLRDFVAALDDINALAERSPGFVWRLKSDSGNATDIRAYDDPLMIVNLTVWADIEALFDFTYRSGHARMMARRRDWFEKMAQPHMVLWWIPAGHLPVMAEAKERLDLLRRRGPSPDAFTFKTRFSAPTSAASGLVPAK